MRPASASTSFGSAAGSAWSPAASIRRSPTSRASASAPSTISRILDLFPKDMHSAMRQNLAFNLKGIVAQKLLPTTKEYAASTGRTRVPLVEVMRMNPTVKKLILNEEDLKLAQAIRLGKEEGMVEFTESLRQLVVAEKIERATAFEVA